jgi:hypothetical protein
MKPLSEVKLQKYNIFKNFLLVVILSTGVSLIANAITKETNLLIAVIPGALCVLFVALCYIKEYFGCSSYEVNVDTLLPIDKEKNIIEINRFSFNEDFYNAFVSVMSENKAYKPLWEDSFEWKDRQRKKGKTFVNEFLEYLYVHWISLKLNSYFSGVDNDATEIIGREQIPDVLIKNRVIELISKPYEEREKFQKMVNGNESDNGKIVYMNGEDGAFYDRLEIELPRNSKVCRDGDSLIIKNRNFDIRFESKFMGFGTVLPRYFESYYMNRAFEDVHNYKISLKMSIKLKPFFLLSYKDWKYLGWLDQIGEKFVEYFSFDVFINRIGFEQAVTSHLLFLNGMKERKECKNRKYADIRIVKVDDEEE